MAALVSSSLTAKNVLDQGVGYLTSRGYQVLPDDGSDRLLDPKTVDWRAVANGSLNVRVRQLPGPANSMGEVKFGFPNAQDIYLHGGYQLRGAGDIAMVGDYVGLAGVGSTLMAAIVLPESDDWRSELTAYAGVVT